MNLKTRIISIITAAFVAVGSVTMSLLMSPTASADFSVNFDEGSYSTWDGISYTFDWYTSPSVVDDVTIYTISQASDLAGLAVITNNLSNEKFNYITDNIAGADRDYIASVDNFEGKVIKLDTNIDLADFDWLGIGYPWSTPALTASTEFVNVNGETVKYNAVDHIPDDTVDPWVGDKNGNPISTRYKEYPEAELRFRDYTKAITKDSTHSLTYDDYSRPRKGPADFATIPVENFYIKQVRHGPSSAGGEAGVLYKVEKTAAVVTLPTMLAWGIDYSTDIAIPYTFKDIKNYTETKGFAGTFDGQNYKIKGLNPDTTWTDDSLERLTTYEPLARGLFSMLDEKGTIKDLSVKGSYDNKIVSYSALLCAYNYGTIDSCYVDGKMEQSLIEQIYPVARDYDPDGSAYKLSDLAGTVMPSGNAGFLTSQNYGIIKNSYTIGEVTQAFRQFGFFASTNYGTIDTCENRANLTTQEVQPDFHTDEWGYRGCLKLPGFGELESTHDPHWEPLKNYPQADTELPLRYHHLNSYYEEALLAVATNEIMTCTTAGVNGTSAPVLPWKCDEQLWIPDLYMTNEGESIAANHLYGCYEIALAGGITAVNLGSIVDCTNSGDIDNSNNLITICSWYSDYYDEANTLDDADDVYSYIRATNQYGLFSTAVNGVKSRGGITAVNLAELKNCINNGTIASGGLIDAEGFEHETELSHDGGRIAAIAATQNGFYQNDVKFELPDGTTIYTPWGLRWWVTEDLANTYLSVIYSDDDIREFSSEHFDRNMPYPFYLPADCSIYNNVAGIAGANAGSIDNCTNTNCNTIYSITYCSNKSVTDDSLPIIKNCSNEATLASRYLTNTCTEDLNLKHTLAVDLCQTDDYTVFNNNIIIQDEPLVKYRIVGTAQGALSFENIISSGNPSVALASSCGYVQFKNIYADSCLINSNNNNAVFTNIVINGYDDASLDYHFNSSEVKYSGSIFGDPYTLFPNHLDYSHPISDVKINNLYILNSNYHALGNFIDSEIQNVFVYTDGMAGLGRFKNCSITDVQIFGNNAFMHCDTCEITDFLSYGTITDRLINRHKDDFIYQFINSNCTNMYLESDVDFEFSDPLVTGKIQHIPGILKAYFDTNIFDHCAVVTPDGMVSYSSTNMLDSIDDSIKTDAALVYSKNAARNGALAYYLDHGYSDARTYKYTVAFNDTVKFSDFIPNDMKQYISPSTLSELTQSIILPAYTRLKKDESEDSYYRIQVPYVSAGAGEIKASINRNGDTWSTNATDNLFPKTELFAIPGETVNFDVTAEDGFELIGLTLSTKSSNTQLESIKTSSEPYKFESIVMSDEDVIVESKWSNVWAIEVDETLADWLTLTTSAQGAAVGRTINITYDVLDPNYEVGEIYYYPYVKNADNNWVIDTSDKHVIDLMKASFTMPASPIKLYASALNGNAQLIDIVIAGEHGAIDEFNNVTVVLNSSIDITSLAVDSVTLSDNATISPAIDIPQDFTSPVEYIVKSESGKETRYLVQVVTTQDGFITRFDLKGRRGIIDQDAGTITVTLSETEDITNTAAYVIWSGTSISPDPEVARDYSNSDIEFTVTSSAGETKTYQVIINRQTFSSAIEELALDLNGEELTYEINPTNKTIIVSYPYGADVSSVTLKHFAFAGANSNLIQGQCMNLTISHDIIIVDEAGNTETYTIMANEMPNPRKEIAQFILYGCAGIINQDDNTITINVPVKYDITNITPDAIAFIGALIKDANVKRDFTSPITYTVEGFDGTERDYTVIVNQI